MSPPRYDIDSLHLEGCTNGWPDSDPRCTAAAHTKLKTPRADADTETQPAWVGDTDPWHQLEGTVNP